MIPDDETTYGRLARLAHRVSRGGDPIAALEELCASLRADPPAYTFEPALSQGAQRIWCRCAVVEHACYGIGPCERDAAREAARAFFAIWTEKTPEQVAAAVEEWIGST